jgi:hypothetical protein
MGSEKYSFKSLLATPKGTLDYRAGDAFLLLVTWETPSLEAARTLLDGLRQCAEATNRDTPCVPTYFFYISSNNADLSAPAPLVVGDHPHLTGAKRKLGVGAPRHAVLAELEKRKVDLILLDADLDVELPVSMQSRPVMLEFIEVYLDERSFMEHAGSRDFLDGHAVVMNPSLHYSIPRTLLLGTPPASLVDSILDPVLKAEAIPNATGSFVWRRAPASAATAAGDASATALVSIEMHCEDCNSLIPRLSPAALDPCSTVVAFPHPLRPGVARLICVVSSLAGTVEIAQELSKLQPIRGEIHLFNSHGDVKCDEAALISALAAVGLADIVQVNRTSSVGYPLHPRIREVRSI